MYYKISLNTFNMIINEWEHCKFFVLEKSQFNSVEDHKSLLSRNGECAENDEMACISRLFSNYLFKAYCKNITNTADFSYIDYAFCDGFCTTHITDFVKKLRK